MNPANPRNVFRKNTPAETRANWQFVKSRGAAWGRLFLFLLCAALLVPFALGFYALGYFDGAKAVRSEIISKESK